MSRTIRTEWQPSRFPLPIRSTAPQAAKLQENTELTIQTNGSAASRQACAAFRNLACASLGFVAYWYQALSASSAAEHLLRSNSSPLFSKQTTASLRRRRSIITKPCLRQSALLLFFSSCSRSLNAGEVEEITNPCRSQCRCKRALQKHVSSITTAKLCVPSLRRIEDPEVALRSSEAHV